MILATAGHIDHGKTALVRALTGVDADRLPEEKRRGHDDRSRLCLCRRCPTAPSWGLSMCPGTSGFCRTCWPESLSIDRVLLIVAADDGPRPQTLEHLDVLELIGIAEITGVVTKIDRVAAPSGWPRSKREVAALLDAAGLCAAARSSRCRAVTGDGHRRARRASARERADRRRGARRTAGERAVPAADRPRLFAARHRAGRDRHGGVRRGRGRRPAAGQPARRSRCGCAASTRKTARSSAPAPASVAR